MPSHISSWIFKVITPIFIVAVIVFALWSGFHQKKASVSENDPSSSTSTGQNLTQNSIAADLDHDSLKDWEEALWKTDPNNPDTDGDGVPDGEEVKEGRDPTKKGPGDTLSLDNIRQVTYSQNSSIEPQTSQNFSLNSTNIASTSLPAPTIDQKTVLALKTYGNSIATLIHKQDVLQSDQETKVFASITSKSGPTPADFDGLQSFSDGYNKLSQSIDIVLPPKEVQSIHNALVEAYVSISNGDTALASYKNSGSIPTSAFQSYNSNSLALGKALIAIAVYFKNNEISFTQSEPGAIFNIP